MNNFGEQINLIINNIADKLGVAVNKLYPALMKQALIDGITKGISFIFGLVITIVPIIILIKGLKKPKLDKYNEWTGGQFGIFVSCIICIFIGFLFMACNLNGTLTALFNPNWYMINNIITQIK